MDSSASRSEPHVRVKICGLTTPHDAARAEALGAAYLGCILASGPRRVELPEAQRVLGARRATIDRVAVFGPQSLEDTARIADTLDLDVVQLHGTLEREVTVTDIVTMRTLTHRTLWPVLRVHGDRLPPHATELALAAGAIVLDAKVTGQLGGTGVTLAWTALRAELDGLRRAAPSTVVILAGGLRPDNVATAIAALRPDVVDVSSGIERAPGIKDGDAMARFVDAASSTAPQVPR